MVGGAHRVVLEVQKNLGRGLRKRGGLGDLDGDKENGFSFLEEGGVGFGEGLNNLRPEARGLRTENGLRGEKWSSEREPEGSEGIWAGLDRTQELLDTCGKASPASGQNGKRSACFLRDCGRASWFCGAQGLHWGLVHRRPVSPGPGCRVP